MSQIAVETAIIMVIGLLGAVLPLFPGPPIIWLGALYYAWRTDWTSVGWPSLTLLLLLAIAGSTADIWVSSLGARRGGASGWATLASIVGGVIGLFTLGVFGAIAGSLAGIVLVEYMRYGNWHNVLRASRGYVVGWLLSMVVQVAVCVLMIGLFIIAMNV
jgi:uncharacterized protein YqgC (DUF456 family)